MLSLLNLIPFNGYKMYIGLVAGALVLGFQQLGYISPDIAAQLLKWIVLWTGVALAHKVDKAIAATATVTNTASTI